jgi:hypothetical protein
MTYDNETLLTVKRNDDEVLHHIDHGAHAKGGQDCKPISSRPVLALRFYNNPGPAT